MFRTKQILKDKGTSAILAQQELNEEVLPDNTPRALLLETVKYKLDRCGPTTSLLLIDPYINPTFKAASDYPPYEADLLTVLEPTLRKVSTLRIATRPNRNAASEARLDTAIRAVNASITINKKNTDAFHDRFWIVDDARGIFLGTSFNGIGKRYALIGLHPVPKTPS